jgi:sugar O-acyltransferase (sialic acid O-acetyltransferase NeuD family)
VERVIIVGASGQARVVIDILELAGRCAIVGLVDRRVAPGTHVGGHPVLGTDLDLARLSDETGATHYLIAVGDNHTRGLIAARIADEQPRLRPATAIHPSAVIARSARIGEGSAVMAGSVINPGATVGCHCIVNTGATLDHDSVVGDFASLAPGVTTGGDVRIGAFAAIGIGATVSHGIEIGEQTVVGAGSTVVRSLGPGVVAWGSPARVMRTRQPGDRYL